MEIIKKEFSDWTEYDEENKKIFVEYCQKAQWVAEKNAAENKKTK